MPMHTGTRALRFTAVLAFVVLSLTGFSTGRHHSSHRGGGGGGCSSSHQDHDTSSSITSGGGTYGDSHSGSDDDSYSGGGTGTSGSTGGRSYQRRPTHRATSTPSGGSRDPLKDGTARLISCATGKKPYATVEITNPNNRAAEFQARVTFYDDEGTEILDNASSTVRVPAKGRATTRVTVGDRLLPKVDHCEADRDARVRS